MSFLEKKSIFSSAPVPGVNDDQSLSRSSRFSWRNAS